MFKLRGNLNSEEIPDGEDGIYKSVEKIAGFIDDRSQFPVVRGAAEEITRYCISHDGMCQVRAIYDFVRTHVRYRNDPEDFEFIKSPAVQLEEIRVNGFTGGDCDDQTALIAALLKSLGFSVRLVVISQKKSQVLHHIYSDVKLMDRWLSLDSISYHGIIGVRPYATRREYLFI